MTDTSASPQFLMFSAEKLRAIASLLADWNSEWVKSENEADVLRPEEYPFDMSLEDLCAHVDAAAERLEQRADEIELGLPSLSWLEAMGLQADDPYTVVTWKDAAQQLGLRQSRADAALHGDFRLS